MDETLFKVTQFALSLSRQEPSLNRHSACINFVLMYVCSVIHSLGIQTIAWFCSLVCAVRAEEKNDKWVKATTTHSLHIKLLRKDDSFIDLNTSTHREPGLCKESILCV